MADSYIFHENSYNVQVSGFAERPWTLMEPLYIGDVPSGRGTPGNYCMLERNGKSYLCVHVYGESHLGIQAVFWHSWLVINSLSYVHFIAIEEAREIAAFEIGYFCCIYPTEERLLAESSEKVFCFNKDAQQLWCFQNPSVDEVKITSVEGEYVLVKGYLYAGEDELPYVSFVLSLETGHLIRQG